MRDTLDPPRPLDPPSRTQWRRKRLHRGAKRWHRDVVADGIRHHRVFLFALTVESLDPEVAQGAIRQLMHRLVGRHKGIRRFWWCEFQRRGALHIHGLLIDAPFEYSRDAKHWFEKRWPLATIQPWTEQRSWAWFRDNAADYVLKDVGKGRRKGHQQQYENMPYGWRTFASDRLHFTAEEHAPHEDRGYVAQDPTPAAPGPPIAPRLVMFAQDVHVPAHGGCHLVRDDRLRARRKALQRR